MKTLVLILAVISVSVTQRSPYAGKNPIGYPYIESSTDKNALGTRFGSEDGSTTTLKIPIEARGDAELVKKLSKLPVDQQPFWLLNSQALENLRNNPITYPQRKNSFIDN